MIIDEIKLKLDLAMYKGKTRLRQWYPIVLGHMKEIEATQNNLADKVIKGEDKLQKTNDTLTIALEETAVKHDELDLEDMQLRQRIKDESQARSSGDTLLDRKISNLSSDLVKAAAALLVEEAAREEADKALDGQLSEEETARKAADSELQASIDTLNAGDTVPGSVAKAIKDSINAFASALTDDGTINTYAEALNWIQTHGAEYTTLLGQVTANMTNIKELQGVSHAHDNKDVIDYITAEDIERLRTFKSQVTQEQLEEALADEATEREKGNAENVALFDYLEDVAFGHEREFHLLYLALGIGHYNGSLFGTPYDDDNLDGGDFDNEPENTIDFGDFEPIIISVPSGDAVDVIDGGTY